MPRARVEQELEALRYQTYIQQQLVRFVTRLKIENISYIVEMLLFYDINFFFFSFSSFMQREEKDALVARQIALSLDQEERQRERQLQEMMRLQLRLGDEAMQREFERCMQEERDEVVVIFLQLMKPL